MGCIPGYFLQIGQCVYPASGFDQNCITYDVSAFCSSCKPGYYLLNYICTRIDPFCVNFDYVSQICTECGGGKKVEGSGCKWSFNVFGKYLWLNMGISSINFETYEITI